MAVRSPARTAVTSASLRSDGTKELTFVGPDSRICPSVDHLFYSVAKLAGGCATGVILSGRGNTSPNRLLNQPQNRLHHRTKHR